MTCGDKEQADPSQAVLALRPELRFVPRREDERMYYVVEDPLNSKYYRIGASEYAFISALDGERSVREAQSVCTLHNPHATISGDDAVAVARWLVQTELALCVNQSTAIRGTGLSATGPQRSFWRNLNPISVKIPLLRPDRLFDRLQWAAFHAFSPLGAGIWLAAATVAIVSLFPYYAEFAQHTNGILAIDNWLWLGGSWLFLKAFHEAAHGMACKRYGGTVREAGVIFILFAPLAYVDVSSSTRFRSRWHRIVTAGAGIYTELFVAALAAVIWSHSSDGLLRQACHNIVLMASVTTMLFNANPLMRFDGYYILSDALGIPNLYSRGQAVVHRLARSVFLDLPTTGQRHDRRWFVACYGIAAFCWRVIVSVSLILVASTLYDGAGIILSLLAIGMWLRKPLCDLVRLARGASVGPKLKWPRVLVLVFGVACPSAVAAVTVSWPMPIRAPAIVNFSPLTIVRAASPGFVTSVNVRNGEYVERGTVLARLENPQLLADLADIRLEIKQSVLRSRSYERHGQLAAYQAESERRRTLEKQHAEKQDQVNALVITAPVAGYVLRRQLDSVCGTYLSEGTELVSIGSSQKELTIAVAQDDIDFFSRHAGKVIRVRLPGVTPMFCQLTRVQPRATRSPPHVSLSATAGGPLPVRHNQRGGTDQVELIAPRFIGTACLTPEQSKRVRAGQIGVVGLGWNGRAIGPHLYQVVTHWVRAKLGQRQT